MIFFFYEIYDTEYFVQELTFGRGVYILLKKKIPEFTLFAANEIV